MREQPQPLLDREHPPHRGVEARRRIAALLQRGGHGVQGGIWIGGHQQQIGARQECAHGGLAGAILGDDRAHRQRIGDHESVKVQRIAQHARQHRGRERRGVIRAGDGGEGDVRAHHHVRTGGDAGPERHQLQGIEAPVVGGDHR